MNTTFLSTLIFYSNILIILSLTFITANLVMWLMGALQILHYQKHLKLNFNELINGTARNDRQVELIDIYRDKLLNLNIKTFRWVFIRTKLSRTWVNLNLALVIFMMLTITYSYFKLRSFSQFSSLLEEHLALYLILLLGIMSATPLIVYYVFTDKFERDKLFKLQCHKEIREHKKNLVIAQKNLEAILNEDGSYKTIAELKAESTEKAEAIKVAIYSLNEVAIYNLNDDNDLGRYKQRCLVEIAQHHQAIRCYSFITIFLRLLQAHNGSDPTASSLVNAWRYIRSLNPASRYYVKRLFDSTLRIALSDKDIYSAIYVKSAWPYLDSDLSYIGNILNELYGANGTKVDQILGENLDF